MKFSIELPDKTVGLLMDLAFEKDGKVEDLIVDFVNMLDSSRHVVWSRSQRKFVRGKCYCDKCFETEELPPLSDRGD